jgi:hypothetical protein
MLSIALMAHILTVLTLLAPTKHAPQGGNCNSKTIDSNRFLPLILTLDELPKLKLLRLTTSRPKVVRISALFILVSFGRK